MGKLDPTLGLDSGLSSTGSTWKYGDGGSNQDVWESDINKYIAPLYSPEEQSISKQLTSQAISNDNPWMLPPGFGFNQDFLQSGSDPSESGYAGQAAQESLWNTVNSAGAFTYEQPPEEGGQGGAYWGGGGGGGGGGSYSQSTGYQPSDVQWTIGDYNVGNFENAPDWWQPMIPTNQTELNNPQVAYTMMQNALIGSGTLSEEDARASAKSLSKMWGMQESNNPWGLYTTTPDSVNLGEFAGLDPMSAKFQAPQSEEQAALGFTAPKTIDSSFMQSQGRAQQMLDSINNMQQATIGDDQYKFGPGLDYLQSIAGSLGEQGNQGRLTRQESLEMRGVMDPMLAQSAGGELGPYSEIARMMSNPFFANQPPGLTQMPGGGTQFGERNRNLSF